MRCLLHPRTNMKKTQRKGTAGKSANGDGEGNNNYRNVVKGSVQFLQNLFLFLLFIYSIVGIIGG